MAVNFRIDLQRKKVNFQCKISGDFDGSAAFELINALTANCRNDEKVIINTNGLSSVHPFGVSVFQKNCSVNRLLNNLTVTGKYGQELVPDDRHLV